MTGGQAEGVCTDLWPLWARVWHFQPMRSCLGEAPGERATQACNHGWDRLFEAEACLAYQQSITEFHGRRAERFK